MVKKMMLALAAVALLAAPSFAAVQNVKVGGDLKTTSVIRQNLDLGTTSGVNTNQSVFLSQIGLNVSSDLTDNVSTSLRLINERLWGTDATANGGVVVDTANVTLKEFLYSPLTVTIGRQSLAYGNQFLVGDTDLNSSQVTTVGDLTGQANADAIKAVLSYDPLTVDVFAARITQNTTVGSDLNSDLFGINANYKLGDAMSTVVEGYVFVKKDNTIITGSSVTKGNRVYVPGLRVSTNPVEGLNVQLEGAYEVGALGQGTATQGKVDLSAYGLQGKVNYALPVLKDMNPVVSAGYTYLSGDKDSTDGKSNAFQSLYENQTTGRIFDSIFAVSNLQIAELALEVAPVADVTTKLTWYNLSQAKKSSSGLNSANGADGSTLGSILNSDSKKYGNELDLDVTYAYTEDVKLGVSAGLFMPGDKFVSASQDNASQILSSVSVMF